VDGTGDGNGLALPTGATTDQTITVPDAVDAKVADGLYRDAIGGLAVESLEGTRDATCGCIGCVGQGSRCTADHQGWERRRLITKQ